MIRFHVQAVERQNYKGCSRAGRFWPSGEAVEVMLYDQDEDPEDVLNKEGGSTRHTESPRRIGKKSFEMMKADRRLRIINAGDPSKVETEVVANLRARFDRSWEDLKATHAHELSRLQERHDELEKRGDLYRDEHDKAVARIAELEAELAAGKEHAAKLEGEIAELLEAPAEGKEDTQPGKKKSGKKAEGAAQ